MTPIVDWLQANFSLPAKIVYSLLVLLIISLFRWGVVWLVDHRIKDKRRHYVWLKNSTYIVGFAGILIISWIWFEHINRLATYLGLLSAGLAIALRDPIANIMGWAFIVWRRPFEVGDRIQLGPHTGDVIDLRVFQFTMMEVGNWVAADQSTGRMIHVPNGKIFTDTLANYTGGFEYIWNEIPVLIPFEANWEKAKKLLLEIVNRQVGWVSQQAKARVESASRRVMLVYPTLTPIVYTRVSDSGVLLTIRYLIPARRRRGSENDIWEDILATFANEPDVRFAYKTQRVVGVNIEPNRR